MLSLAVFYFVFLGTEYLFDNRMALYTDPSGVVLAQSYILGVSVFGFLAYSLIEKWKSKSGNPTAFKAAGFFLPVPVIAGYVLLFVGTGYGVLLGSGCFLFLILGYLGSRTHYLAAQLLRGSRHPAKTVSVAYAVGLLLQFLNHNLLWGETVEGIFLAVSFVVLWILTVGMSQDALSGYGGIKHCLIPSPKHILVDRDENGNLVDWLYSEEQTAKDMLKILGYK